ncbi:MAG: hypothetical protein WC683_06025 [bacterium]
MPMPGAYGAGAPPEDERYESLAADVSDDEILHQILFGRSGAFIAQKILQRLSDDSGPGPVLVSETAILNALKQIERDTIVDGIVTALMER